MRTLLMLLIALATPPATAGTVLTYGYATTEPKGQHDEPPVPVLALEIQDGRVRVQDLEYADFELFDPANAAILEYQVEDRIYDVHDAHDEYADPDVKEAVQRTEPKRLGKTRRAGHPCVMHSYPDGSVTWKVCLADAAALGIPAKDAAALQAFADFTHQLRDLGLYSTPVPLAFSTVSGVGIWNHELELLKVEQRDLPRERFEMPQGYTRYEPEIDEDGL